MSSSIRIKTKNKLYFYLLTFLTSVVLINSKTISASTDADIQNLKTRTNRLEQEIKRLKSIKDDTDVDLTRRLSAVGTGPYFGLGTTYDGSDLVVLQPSIHKDLNLLFQNQKMAKATGGILGPSSPYVQLSGVSEIQARAQSQSSNSVDLTAANLDIAGWINPWLTAYANFGIETDETKNGNFRMIIAFLTFGNLDKSPFYATIGQIFVPFGSFSTGTSDMGTLTRSVGRIYERGLGFGFYPGNGLHLSGAVYNGHTKNSASYNLDQFAGMLSYKGNIKVLDFPLKIRTGVSYTNNLAETASIRNIFNNPAQIHNFVPGSDVFAHLYLGPVVLRGEFVSALEKFSSRDVLQNGKRIKPRSFLTEIEYDTYILGKSSWVTLHYSENIEGVIATPVQHQTGLNGSMVILKNTILSLEYSHRKNFSSNNQITNIYPTGSAFSPLNADNVTPLNASLNHKSSNVLVATLDVFY